MSYITQLKLFSFFGNTLYDYALAIAIFVGVMILLKIFQLVALSRLKKWSQKSKNNFDDLLVDILRSVRSYIYFFISFYVALKFLELPDVVNMVFKGISIIVIVYEIIRAANKIADFFVKRYLNALKKVDDEKTRRHNESMARAAKLALSIILWVLAIILVMSNLGINVTSLIAGLGIGGIAVALALQNILGDMFSSFSLYVDRPFQIGDFIIAGQDMGVVKKIGLKTTRITTLQGEELVVSNKELSEARVQNFKQMKKRRVAFNIGVVYQTKPEQIRAIPKYVKEIVDGIKNADFDRCHFAKYGASSLDFEIVYYVGSADYNEYMDINQEINLAIFEKFAKEGIEFAYPTQTVFVDPAPHERRG